MYILSALMLTACLSLSQAESQLSSRENKKRAQAMINNILETLQTKQQEREVLPQDSDDDMMLQRFQLPRLQEDNMPSEQNNLDDILKAQADVNIPKAPAEMEGDDIGDGLSIQNTAVAQRTRYVKIPYRYWRKVWPYYYYVYYRNIVIRLIRKGY